ncbi:MAG: PrsW family glutamic-type intramembrane protease [Methanomicrobiales archaeon]|nr:PrsW family glutamic-type intramembrane protease [Methanomicrobiales archaeon]
MRQAVLACHRIQACCCRLYPLKGKDLPVDPLLILPLAVAPGIFWMFYFYLKDRYEPEPPAAVIRIFLLGGLVVIPAAFLELLASYVVPAFLLTVAAGPLIEEFAKFGVVRGFVYDSPEFDEPMDGIIYAVAAALGFATLENVLYVGTSALTSVPLALGVAAVRAFLSVPAHALISLSWRAALGWAKFMPPARGRAVVAAGFLFAVLLHGIFNFMVTGSFTLVVLVILIVPLAWVVSGLVIHRTLERERRG